MSGNSKDQAQFSVKKTLDSKRQAQPPGAPSKIVERLALAERIFHDVNNLLLVMYYSCYQLLSKASPDDSIRADIQAIEDARTQSADLIRQFRSTNMQPEGHSRSVDLNELVRQVEELVRPVVSNDIVLTVNLCSCPAPIDGDASDISRILFQLVLNAIGSVGTGGWVTVTTQVDGDDVNGIPSTAAPLHSVRLSVTDTGAAAVDHKTSPPVSTSNSTERTSRDATRVPALIKKLITTNCGRIDIKNSEDVGTNIAITFPLNSETLRPSVIRASSTHCHNGGETILLVEDDVALRRLIKASLASHGYNVIEAEGGNSAVLKAMVHEDQIHLLLTDLRLPEYSGQELAEKLLAEYPGLRLLFMSGDPNSDSVLESSPTKTAGFLQKPFRTEDLLTKVREILDLLR